MAAQKGDATGWLKMFTTVIRPALQHFSRDILLHFIQMLDDKLQLGEQRRRVRAQKCLGCNKGGHGLVVAPLPVQIPAQFIVTAHSHVPVG